MQRVIAKAGVYGPLVFIVFQAFQVLFPILPGGVSGSLAMLCFGTWKGFFYSYIGVLIGSRPDDLLCMIAGLSSISFWKFFWIIVIGKPISSFFYSYFIVKIMGLI